MKRLWAIAAACAVAAAGPASSAEISSSKNFKKQVKDACAAFYDIVADDFAEKQKLLERKNKPAPRRLPSAYPETRPLPYICIWVRFDVDEKGRPLNAEIVFKAPASASEAFDRAALKTVRRWRYGAAGPGEQAYIEGALTEITFETH